MAPAREPNPREHPEYAETDPHQARVANTREDEIDNGEAGHEEGIEDRPKDRGLPGITML